MNSGSIPFWDGSYNFTDITEFKPTQCFYKEGHAEKGQGLTRGHTQEDSGEAQKQRTTSWGKTPFSKPPNAFPIAGMGKCDLNICKGRLRMKHSVH